jgi:hypothetical protein
MAEMPESLPVSVAAFFAVLHEKQRANSAGTRSSFFRFISIPFKKGAPAAYNHIVTLYTVMVNGKHQQRS